MSAIRGYEGVARREPGGWKAPILLGGGVTLAVIVRHGVRSASSSGLADFGVFGAALAAFTTVLAAIGVGGFLFWAARRSQIQKRAQRYGQRAFVNEYAASPRPASTRTRSASSTPVSCTWTCRDRRAT